MSNSTTELHEQPKFSQKVWIAGGILFLILILLLLFKALFSVILLVLAGVLISIYFHGFAGLLNKWLHIPQKASVLCSVLINLLLLIGFFWFVGDRLQSQISQLSDTLPKSLENAKAWLKDYPGGDKLLSLVRSSGDSAKTLTLAKSFFSSSFGILSDI